VGALLFAKHYIVILNKISKPSKKAIPLYIGVIPVCDEQTGPHLRRWIIKSHNISKQINMTPLTRRYSLLEQTGPHLPIRLGPHPYIYIYI
jgi:hypothetical protein